MRIYSFNESFSKSNLNNFKIFFSSSYASDAPKFPFFRKHLHIAFQVLAIKYFYDFESIEI
jgi:hypothetical protein